MGKLLRFGAVGVLAAAGLTLGAAPAQAATVHVVPPGGSIQAAVDAAHPGDTIKLSVGTYDGGVKVTTNGLTIKGAGPVTIIRPGGVNHCLADAGPAGICVVGAPGHPVTGVTITALTVRNFPSFGVAGFGTDRLTVTEVVAKDNDEYGITEFASTRGAFLKNYVTGTSDEAGLYVGDIADAHGTRVEENYVSNSALGILVRHARNVVVSENLIENNCTGIALVDDGQPGGQGATTVRDNVLRTNNHVCPPHEEVPPLQGTGIVLIGGTHNRVLENTILDNRGAGPLSGGIVLVPGVGGAPAAHNTFTENVVQRNKPADIVNHGGSPTNVFHENVCTAGLC